MLPTPNPKLVFTFCSGRCGTQSISGYFSQVQEEKDTIGHEFLQPDLTGEMTPGTDTLANYNCRGFRNRGVQDFWERKFTNVANLGAFQEHSLYVETSHLLGKAGLVEALLQQLTSISFLQVKPEIYLLFPARDPLDTIASMYIRGDYHSIENRRVWYLEPTYQRNLILYDAPDLPFDDSSEDMRINHIAWYYWEMRVRQTMWINLLMELFHPQIRVYQFRVDNKEEFKSEMEEIIGDVKRKKVELEQTSLNATPEFAREQLKDVKELIKNKHNKILVPFDGEGETALEEFIKQFKNDFYGHFIESQGIKLPTVFTEDESRH